MLSGLQELSPSRNTKPTSSSAWVLRHGDGSIREMRALGRGAMYKRPSFFANPFGLHVMCLRVLKAGQAFSHIAAGHGSPPFYLHRPR